MSEAVRLTRSGWEATDITPHSLTLRYDGSTYVRSQSVIRYSDGTFGYSFPEIVPKSVKAKVRKLLNEAYEETKSPLQRLAEASPTHEEDEMRKNDNVLAGIECPHCGSQGPFVMAVTRRGYATVSDDGYEDFDGYEDEVAGPCECCDCGELFNCMDFDDNTEEAKDVLINKELDRILNHGEEDEPEWDIDPSSAVTATELALDNRPE